MSWRRWNWGDSHVLITDWILHDTGSGMIPAVMDMDIMAVLSWMKRTESAMEGAARGGGTGGCAIPDGWGGCKGLGGGGGKGCRGLSRGDQEVVRRYQRK